MPRVAPVTITDLPTIEPGTLPNPPTRLLFFVKQTLRGNAPPNRNSVACSPHQALSRRHGFQSKRPIEGVGKGQMSRFHLHPPLPVSPPVDTRSSMHQGDREPGADRSEEHTSELQS